MGRLQWIAEIDYNGESYFIDKEYRIFIPNNIKSYTAPWIFNKPHFFDEIKDLDLVLEIYEAYNFLRLTNSLDSESDGENLEGLIKI